MKNQIINWTLRLVPSIILLQTLFFKFSGAEESIFIFSQLGAEPAGRIGSGIIELIAGILLIIPATSGIGAVLGIGTMTGAIASHLTILGIEVMNDGGQLFVYALITWLCCLAVAWKNRHSIPILNRYFQ
ncbi:MAG TPA: DoxX family protein [Catalimonadaceae bacterium]|nr:DoxX family protein [Catalimonadaceae bacterium]